MTIQATPSEISYAADGITTVFAIPFPFDTSADLKLTSTDASGNILTLSTGFAISGGAGSTGNATFSPAPVAGLTITIYDNPALTQPTNYVSLDAFPAESHERALDRVTRIAKRLYQLVQRSVRFPDGDVSTDGVLGSVANRKGKYLFFNAVTGAIEYAVSIVGQALSQSIIGQLLNPQTNAEAGAAVVPTNYWYGAGDLRRYGAAAAGNITSALVSAAAQAQQAGGASIYVASALGTACTVTAGVIFSSPVTIYGDGYQKSQFSTANDITVFTFNLGASASRLADFQITGKGTGATLPGILFTNCNQCRMERIRVAFFGVNVRFAQGANSCYLNCMIDCRIESAQTITIDAQKATNQLRLFGVTCGGGPSTVGLKLTDCSDCNAIGLNIENPSLVGIDIDNPSGSTFAGSGHTFVDPHFETACTAGDIRIGNTALVNGVTVIGGYTNPTGAVDCGINIGVGGCNGLRVIGHAVNAGYSGGVGYLRLTGTLTNEIILLGGPFAGTYSQYFSQGGKVNYADRGTLTLDAPSFLDAAIQDWVNSNYYKINSGSIVTNKDYTANFAGLRIESTGAIAAGSRVYSQIMFMSNAQGGATKAGAGLAHGDFDIESGALSIGQTASAQVVANGNTINTTHVGVARCAPAGAVTGVILQAGITQGQVVWVVNESIAGSTITFAAAGTSNVADGVLSVIAGLNARTFVWNSVTALWYPSK